MKNQIQFTGSSHPYYVEGFKFALGNNFIILKAFVDNLKQKKKQHITREIKKKF